MFCKRCTYPLSHTAERTCPECGRAFDPDKPRSYLPTPVHPRRFWSDAFKFALLAFLAATGVSVINEFVWGDAALGYGMDDIGLPMVIWHIENAAIPGAEYHCFHWFGLAVNLACAGIFGIIASVVMWLARQHAARRHPDMLATTGDPTT